uniref:Cardiotrophin like cytokine factor 1 n=1 Tax=Panthera tigris altaica TaxID=74533 RepID=A0A8C9M4Y6_PANTA
MPAGDSWGMLACLCAVLWHLPAVPALNRTGDPGPGPSIQKTYDLTRYLEHQLRSLAGTYPLPGTEPTRAPGPAHSDFLQKMDDFWLLKELQTWLWRSAKDFNRLKKKTQPPPAAVTLHLEAHGF